MSVNPKTLMICASVIFITTIVRAIEMPSQWDMALPEMELNCVSIHESSLESAWQKISKQFNLRTNLIAQSTNEKLPFDFDAEKCTGRDVLNALTETYKGFTWTQDPLAGVIWLHPKDDSMMRAFDIQAVVEADQYGVPMLTGLLKPLAENSGGIIRVKSGGTSYLNTFDGPVDILRGTYKVRDLLNICCVAEPSYSFYLRIEDTEYVSITPDNLFSVHLAEVPPGILLFWELENGQRDDKPPTDEEIIAKLADPNSRIRWAARSYLSTLMWKHSSESLVQKAERGEEALWVCVAAAIIHARVEGMTGHSVAAHRLQAELTEPSLTQYESGAVVTAAMALVKLNNDANALAFLSQKKEGIGDLTEAMPEINYLVRTSQRLRTALQRTGTDWLTTANPSLRNAASRSERAALTVITP